MPGLLLPTASNVRPSYKSGFARSAADSASPGLWPDNAWIPSLGATGTTVRDVVGNYDGTIVNGEATDWTSSKYGPAVVLDGSAEYIDCGQVPRTDNVPQLSVGVWYKPNGSDTNNGIVARRDNSDGSDWSWYMRVTTSSVININAGLGGNFNGTTAITDTSHWYYLQWVFRSGSYTRLYVDGVQDFNHVIGVINLPTAPDGEHNFWIGAYYSSAFGMNGQFGPCYVHRRSLQPSEIRQLHRDPLAPFRRRRFTPTISGAAAATTRRIFLIS